MSGAPPEFVNPVPAEELRPGALARADLMFSWPRVPWNPTWF
jgi:hypothetical protein